MISTVSTFSRGDFCFAVETGVIICRLQFQSLYRPPYHWHLESVAILIKGPDTRCNIARNIARNNFRGGHTMQFSHCAQYCTAYPDLKHVVSRDSERDVQPRPREVRVDLRSLRSKKAKMQGRDFMLSLAASIRSYFEKKLGVS